MRAKTKSLSILRTLLLALLAVIGLSAIIPTAMAQCSVAFSPNPGTGQVTIDTYYDLTGSYTSPDNLAMFKDIVTVGNSTVPPGTYLGWCLDVSNSIEAFGDYNVYMYSSCDPNIASELASLGASSSPPFAFPDTVLDATPAQYNELNYVLNHKLPGASFWDIQATIWNIIGGPLPSDATFLSEGYPAYDTNNVNTMTEAAINNAATWQPQCGNVIAVILAMTAPDAQGDYPVQLTALELPYPCGGTPQLSLFKMASPTNAVLGQPVTYYYTVTNTGGVTVSNINIIDDNGTPSDTNDDFFVNPTPFSLAPGTSMSFAVNHISEPLCTMNNGTNLPVGTLTINVLPNGNVAVWFMQSQGLVDNRYGTNANAATGWSGGHKFNDLIGSDQADFQFTDGNGKVVLEFLADYVSSATSAKFGDGTTISYPSGYGTLGPSGGDGKMITGSSNNVLSVHTTISDDLNQSPTFYHYTVNSPPETSPLSNNSIPPGWNYTDGYYVLISSNAFGAAGFGGVTIPYVHDSPSKLQPIKFMPTNVCSCVENTATAISIQGTAVVASATDSAQVCFQSQSSSGGGGSGCNITAGAAKMGGGGVQIPLKNNGTSPVVMTEADLSWPQATNGFLTQITLNGPAAVWKGSGTSPISLTTTDFNATSTVLTQRTIGPGQTFNLTFQFQHPPPPNAPLSLYTGTVKFGTNSGCAISLP